MQRLRMASNCSGDYWSLWYRSLSSSRKKNFYDILCVDRKATQAEIKAQYYKLSMMYHPDKNDSIEASKKFRDITEAYEILGNYDTRKNYDRTGGHVHQKIPYHKYEAPTTQTYKATRAGIEFDEFYREMYDDVLKERFQQKKNREEYAKQRKKEVKVEALWQNIILLLVISFLFLGQLYVSNDTPAPKDKPEHKKG